MANMGQMSGGRRMPPTPPRGEPIATYATYLEAQRAVDHLSDEQFPVQYVTIVGTGLQMVERVTGRLTYGRVAGAGALSGAWFGLFVGVVLSFLSGGSFGGVLTAMAFGAAFGILFGVISFSLARGRRDFTSTSQIVAGEYTVLCAFEHAAAARQVLARLAGDRPSRGGPTGGPSATAGAGQRAGGPASDGSSERPPLGSMPPPSGPAVLGPPAPPPAQTAPSVGDGGAATDTPAPPAPPGLTYGEAIAIQRRERQERERQEYERQERERQEHERQERERQEHERRRQDGGGDE